MHFFTGLLVGACAYGIANILCRKYFEGKIKKREEDCVKRMQARFENIKQMPLEQAE
jgi:hypothetical protein